MFDNDMQPIDNLILCFVIERQVARNRGPVQRKSTLDEWSYRFKLIVLCICHLSLSDRLFVNITKLQNLSIAPISGVNKTKIPVILAMSASPARQ